jgi:hypothetical protein
MTKDRIMGALDERRQLLLGSVGGALAANDGVK